MQTSEDDDVQMTTVEASLEPLILSPVETAFHIDIVSNCHEILIYL